MVQDAVQMMLPGMELSQPKDDIDALFEACLGKLTGELRTLALSLRSLRWYPPLDAPSALDTPETEVHLQSVLWETANRIQSTCARLRILIFTFGAYSKISNQERRRVEHAIDFWEGFASFLQRTLE